MVTELHIIVGQLVVDGWQYGDLLLVNFIIDTFPKATVLTGGIHALRQTNSVLTYINQLHVKDQDLTPKQVVDFCNNFPGFLEVEFCQIQTPSSFISTSSQPAWAPSWWDAAEFGPWLDCTLVRVLIPPTMKSAANKSNWHHVVIGRRRLNIVKLSRNLVDTFIQRVRWPTKQPPGVRSSTGPNLLHQVITSLKSLRLRKLLDYSVLAYWALLGSSWSVWVLLCQFLLTLPGLT